MDKGYLVSGINPFDVIRVIIVETLKLHDIKSMEHHCAAPFADESNEIWLKVLEHIK